MMVLRLLLFVLTLMFVELSIADDRKYFLDYGKLQYAGNIGWLSVGVGKEFFSRSMNLELFYGYSPEEHSGVDIHMLASKLTFLFLRQNSDAYEWQSLYVGFALSHVLGDNFNRFYKRKYPAGYYGNTSLNVLPLIGSSLYSRENGLGAYLEIATVDAYLVPYLSNDEIPLEEIINLAFGIYYPF